MELQQTKFKETIGIIQIVLGSLLILIPLLFASQQANCSAESPDTAGSEEWFNYMDCSLTQDIYDLAWFMSLSNIIIGTLFILQGITNMKKDILIR